MKKRIPLDSGFLVAKKQCKNCLFSQDRLISPESAQTYIDDCIKNQSYFICHCDTYGEENEEGYRKNGVCCRGFFDAMGHIAQIIRIATRLNVVKFVDLPPLKESTMSWREMHPAK